MLFIPYPYVRWWMALLILIWLGIWVGLRPQGPALIGVILALVITALSWINPPGVYSWLITPTCPQCRGQLRWSIIQPDDHDPYVEEVRVVCTHCGWGRMEFRNLVGPLTAGPAYPE
ncbi:MAG: zinc ribbon domain-containing protein [Anaerolineae bacterium]|nr:zinc ribbon domain-containing protein [Thermoflexus sp.]MDW8064833.1 zinc ribbon domain-containing protein [Anaerolineae bacterium]